MVRLEENRKLYSTGLVGLIEKKKSSVLMALMAIFLFVITNNGHAATGKEIYDKNWDLPRLMKETTKILKLTPDDIQNETKAATSIKQILGSSKTLLLKIPKTG